MRTRHGVEFHEGSTPDNYGPTLTRGWYVRDDHKPGILNGPHATRQDARRALADMRGESSR